MSWPTTLTFSFVNKLLLKIENWLVRIENVLATSLLRFKLTAIRGKFADTLF